MEMEKIIKKLVAEELLLIDTGENILSTCSVEVRRKKRNDGSEVVLFVLKPEEL